MFATFLWQRSDQRGSCDGSSVPTMVLSSSDNTLEGFHVSFGAISAPCSFAARLPVASSCTLAATHAHGILYKANAKSCKNSVNMTCKVIKHSFVNDLKIKSKTSRRKHWSLEHFVVFPVEHASKSILFASWTCLCVSAMLVSNVQQLWACTSTSTEMWYSLIFFLIQAIDTKVRI